MVLLNLIDILKFEKMIAEDGESSIHDETIDDYSYQVPNDEQESDAVNAATAINVEYQIDQEDPIADETVEDEVPQTKQVLNNMIKQKQSNKRRANNSASLKAATVNEVPIATNQVDLSHPYNSAKNEKTSNSPTAQGSGGGRKQKRIIIKNNSTGLRALSSSRRPPTADRKRKEQEQQQKSVPNVQDKALSQVIVTSTTAEDSLFDSLFDQVAQNLENPEVYQPLDQRTFMMEYAERMRKEALASYENRSQQIKASHQMKLKDIENQKAFISEKKSDLQRMMDKIEAKSEVLLQSIDTCLKREIQQPVLEQGWKLLQNWIFSIISDQEKCVRYARIKAVQQIEHIQKEKIRFQESKIGQVISQVQKIKQFPFVKFTCPAKTFKGLKPEITERLNSEIGRNYTYEHIGTIRNKPYIKPQSNSSTFTLTRFPQFPSVTSLIRNATDILTFTDKQLHVTPHKLPTKILNNTPLFESIVLNDVLHPFQDPSLTSKREQRVFICTSSSSNEIAFSDKIDENGCFKVENSISGQPTCSIKRLKHSNQLKIQYNEGSGYSLLSECRLKHLAKWKEFGRYFEREVLKEEDQYALDEVETVEGFYIIEENSLFNVSGQDKQIVCTQRRLKHFRKLNDFEVVLLLSKHFGQCVENWQQPLELKLSQEILKTLQEQTKSADNNEYAVVNAFDDDNFLQKQYLVKILPNNKLANQKQEISSFCHYPNCFQCITPSTQQQFDILLTSPQIAHAPSKKPSRPESANVNRTSQQASTNKAQKRLSRLPIVLEFDIYDSPFLKVLQKRFKQTQQQSAGLVKDKSAKVIQQSNQQTIEQVAVKNGGKGMNLCQYHNELERFYQQKLSILLQPISLIPNTFHKALKSTNFAALWREELKGSLCYDLFAKNSKGQSLMLDNVTKIFALCATQNVPPPPDATGFVELIYQQQPQVINYLENYYQWIKKGTSMQKSIFMRNLAFNEANEHFVSQIKAFNLNLRQAKDNEQYLGTELRKWMSTPQFVSAVLLMNNQSNVTQAQILEIIRSKDVIFKFQQFQTLAERVNSGSFINELSQMPTASIIGMLPKINEQQKQPSAHQTHSSGFYHKQESFNSNKAIDKLTLIYGGIPQGLGVNTNNPNHFSSIKKTVQAPVVQLSTTSGLSQTGTIQQQATPNSGIYDIQSTSNKSQQSVQLYPLPLRKNSAGQRRADDIEGSPISNKAMYKNLGKNEIMLPPAVSSSLSSQNSALVKQRANSAHKQNQQLTLQKQMFSGSSQASQNQQQQDSISRPITNISQYEPNQLQGASALSHSHQFKQARTQAEGLNAHAAMVASTFQNPPPKFPPGGPVIAQHQQFLPPSLIPIQNIYQSKLTRPVLAAQGQMLVNPPQGSNILSSQPQQQQHNLTSKQIRNIEKQQIIVNAYGSQSQQQRTSNLQQHQSQLQPSSTSFGFHQPAGSNSQFSGNPSTSLATSSHRVSSAHQDNNRKKIVQVGEVNTGKPIKKGKKKHASQSNGSKPLQGGESLTQAVQEQYKVQF